MTGKEGFTRKYSPEQRLTVAENFKVLTPKEFGKDFRYETLRAIAISPDRQKNLSIPDSERPTMGLEAMWIEFYGQKERPIFASMIGAVRSGFDVEVHRDWYSETLVNGQFVKLPLSLPMLSVRKNTQDELNWIYNFNKQHLAALEDEGVKIISVNVPRIPAGSLSISRGRDHKKIIFINNPAENRMVSWVGGMNLAEEHFHMIDFMVKFDDPRIVKPLIDEFYRVGENKRHKNAEIKATEDTTILVDTGKEDSLILEQAIKDVDSAQKKVYVSSAFLPSGKFLESLVRAKERGVHVAYITCHPDVAKGIWGLQGKISDLKSRRKSKIAVMFPENKPVHGKALIIDEKSVIFGSHNFINMPHEELSLRSTNPTLLKNFEGFFREVAGDNLDRKLEKDFIIPDSKIA